MNDITIKPSSIEGLGIFAGRPFRAGETITPVVVVREVTPETPIREALGERTDHCSYPDGKVLLIGDPVGQLNHSCDPNAWERFDEGTTSSIVARRPIACGEEVTIDYAVNTTGGSSWPCRCGAARCRGIVRGEFFDLPLELQREYRPLLAEWFIRRNRGRMDDRLQESRT